MRSSGGGGARGHHLDHKRSWSAMNERPMAGRGSAPRKIPSDGGGSDISRVVRVFGIVKIHTSAVVVINPLASMPSSPLLDVWCTLLAAAAPVATVSITTGAGPRQTRGERQAEGVAGWRMTRRRKQGWWQRRRQRRQPATEGAGNNQQQAAALQFYMKSLLCKIEFTCYSI